MILKRQFESLSPELKKKIRYGIIIDAGSSGSRVQVYSWIDTDYLIEKINNGEENKYKDLIRNDGLPVIKQGSSSNDFDGQLKIIQGIATYVNHIKDIGPRHIKLLLDYAEKKIPKEKFEDTEVYLFATAGMRLLPLEQQHKILNEIYNYMKNNYKFKIKDKESSIRVITGEEEGLFGWISTNYLKHGFSLNKETNKKPTYNFVDMGGASTQIAFELDRKVKINGRLVDALENAKSNNSNKNIFSLSINNLYGDSLDFNIFVITFLQYGVNEARRRYLEALLEEKRKDANYQKLLKESKTVTGNKLLKLKKRNEKIEIENKTENKTIINNENRFDNKTIINNENRIDNNPIINNENRFDNKTIINNENRFDNKTEIDKNKSGIEKSRNKLSNITKTIEFFSKNRNFFTNYSQKNTTNKIIWEDEKDKIVWEDPCLPVNARQDIIKPVDYIRLYGKEEGEFMKKNILIKGTGNYDECSQKIFPLLNSTVPCTSDSCLFNNIYSPYTTFDDEKFLAIGQYWRLFNFYNQTGLYNYDNFLASSKELCKTDWLTIKKKYRFRANPYDVALNCFRSAYIDNILHKGYKISKDNNKTMHFNIISYVNGTEASWALGALIEQISDKIGSPTSYSVKNTSREVISSSFIFTAINLFLFSVVIIFLAGIILYRQMGNTSYEKLFEKLLSSNKNKENNETSDFYEVAIYEPLTVNDLTTEEDKELSANLV